MANEDIRKKLDDILNIVQNQDEELKSITSDIRPIIDDRFWLLSNRERETEDMRFSTIEENVKEVRKDIKEIKESRLRDVQKELESGCDKRMEKLEEIILDKIKDTDKKIEKHVDDRIDWRKIFKTTAVTLVSMFIILVILSIVDQWLGLGIIRIIMNFI